MLSEFLFIFVSFVFWYVVYIYILQEHDFSAFGQNSPPQHNNFQWSIKQKQTEKVYIFSLFSPIVILHHLPELYLKSLSPILQTSQCVHCEIALGFSSCFRTKKLSFVVDRLTLIQLPLYINFVFYHINIPVQHMQAKRTDGSLLVGYNALLLLQIARDLLHALSHRLDNTWHSFC